MMEVKQTGFTLIELVVVIVILGILAATALPRFAALQTQARIAKLNGAYGAMKGAASLAHAACLASTPQCTTTAGATGTQLMEGVNVTMVNTYPTADAIGIVAAAGLNVSLAGGAPSPDGYEIANGGPSAGAVVQLRVLGNDSPNCFFSYTSPPAVNTSPTFSVLTTVGC